MNDLPYLEPLLFHLRGDENLKKYFTEKSYFMPKHILVQATDEAMKSDCPAPRALWIIPENTVASGQKSGCVQNAIHTFYIVIFIQCIRDTFQLIKANDRVRLGGQFMELSEIRRVVKKSVNEFENKNKHNIASRFSDITWGGDQNLYPDENNFLTTAIQYSVRIN